MEMNKPEWKETQGRLSAAAWCNERQGRNGGTFQQVSVTLEKRYRDTNGNWKSSSSYTVEELLRLQHFLGKVIDRAMETQSAGGEAA